MPDFSAVLADPTGIVLCDVRAPMTIAFQRNAAVSVSTPLDIEEDAAATLVTALRDGLPRLKVYRRPDGASTGTLIVNAPWAPMQEGGADAEAGLGQLAATFRGPFSILENRFTAASRVFTATDQGTIAWTLVDESNTNDGATGIRIGTIEATTARDRTYEDKQVAEAITQLTGVIGGIDFEVVPVDEGAVCGAFNVYAQQGTDATATAIFEYGVGSDTEGNVDNATRQTRYPVNKARVLGADGLRSEASDTASIAKYGTFMVVEQAVDVSEQATLDAKATALLRPDPIKVVEFTPDPALGPQPWDDFWLGDVVTFRARHGSFREDITVRINGITLEIDEEGNVATMTLTLDQDV